MEVPQLEQLLSPEGWPYASTRPVAEGDPGRFHGLFGRDSLISSLQLLPVRPDVAHATLRALAARQGKTVDPRVAEEPGKILHQHQSSVPEEFADAGWEPGAFTYYASADATPWFLVLLGASADVDLISELDGAWRDAGAWLERALERGGGYLRYGPSGLEGGLSQQGWRDAIDPQAQSATGQGIVRPDGTAPSPPVADADTQAVAYAALRALCRISGDQHWTRRAKDLAGRLEADFGPEVLALEGDGRIVPGAGSHLGWLLWSGAFGGAAQDALADRLAEPDILTNFGLRTLATTHPAYGPHAYHRGAIWPFDSWLGWGGLRSAGRPGIAERVRSGVLEALRRLGHAPELYAVEDDGSLAAVALANRVQAWTVGARWALGAGWDGRPVNGPSPAAAGGITA